MLPISMSLLVFGIGIAYGIQVLSDVKDQFGDRACDDNSVRTSYNETSDKCYESGNTSNTADPDTSSFNASTDSITGVAELPAQLPLIATVVVAAVVIGILVRYLFVRFK